MVSSCWLLLRIKSPMKVIDSSTVFTKVSCTYVFCMYSTGRHSVILTSRNTLVVREYARTRIGAYNAMFVSRYAARLMHTKNRGTRNFCKYCTIPLIWAKHSEVRQSACFIKTHQNSLFSHLSTLLMYDMTFYRFWSNQWQGIQHRN